MKKWQKAYTLIQRERARANMSPEEIEKLLEKKRLRDKEIEEIAQTARLASEKQVALEQEASNNEKDMLEKIEKVIKKPGRPKKETAPEVKVDEQT